MSTDNTPHWRLYDNWGSISSATAKNGSDSVSGLSRAPRCFQVKEPIGEQRIQDNYYGGTCTITPGPGSYNHVSSLKTATLRRPITSSFGATTSVRLMTNSNRSWAPRDKLDIPGPGSYNVTNPTTESFLKSTLGVTRWQLQILKEKERIKESLPIEKKKAIEKELRENYEPLRSKIKSLKAALIDIEEGKKLHAPKFSAAKKTAFTSTTKRWHEEKVVVQEAPSFYMSEANWDFGSECRASAPLMSTFGYAQNLDAKLTREKLALPVIVGTHRPKSHCRDTDFFGVETVQRIASPPVGGYSPALKPMASTGHKMLNLK